MLLWWHIWVHSLSITVSHWKLAQQHTENYITMSLPRDNVTMEFVKIFSSPLQKKINKQTKNRIWNKCFFFKSWPVPSISDRSNRCLASPKRLRQKQSMLRSQHIPDLTSKSFYVLKYRIHSSLILSSASINWRCFSYL